MLKSSADFATALSVLFSPIGSEGDLSFRYPSAARTIDNIAAYNVDMDALREAVQPEIDLIDSRVIGPIKEFQVLLKNTRFARVALLSITFEGC